jgi:hypothetical protein
MSFDKKQIENVRNVLQTIRGPYMGQNIPEKSLSVVEGLTIGDLVLEFGFCIDEAAETLRGIQIVKKKNSSLGFSVNTLKESKSRSRLRKVIRECGCQEMDDQKFSYHPSHHEDGSFSFEDSGSYEEAGMIKSNLQSIATKAQSLYDMVGDSDDLPEWVQEKIAVADEMIDTISDYLGHEYSQSSYTWKM